MSSSSRSGRGRRHHYKLGRRLVSYIKIYIYIRRRSLTLSLAQKRHLNGLIVQRHQCRSLASSFFFFFFTGIISELSCPKDRIYLYCKCFLPLESGVALKSLGGGRQRRRRSRENLMDLYWEREKKKREMKWRKALNRLRELVDDASRWQRTLLFLHPDRKLGCCAPRSQRPGEKQNWPVPFRNIQHLVDSLQTRVLSGGSWIPVRKSYCSSSPSHFLFDEDEEKVERERETSTVPIERDIITYTTCPSTG